MHLGLVALCLGVIDYHAVISCLLFVRVALFSVLFLSRTTTEAATMLVTLMIKMDLTRSRRSTTW